MASAGVEVNHDIVTSDWSSWDVECFLGWLTMGAEALLVWINNRTQINCWWWVIKLYKNYWINSNITASSIHTKRTLYFQQIQESVLTKTVVIYLNSEEVNQWWINMWMCDGYLIEYLIHYTISCEIEVMVITKLVHLLMTFYYNVDISTNRFTVPHTLIWSGWLWYMV